MKERIAELGENFLEDLGALKLRPHDEIAVIVSLTCAVARTRGYNADQVCAAIRKGMTALHQRSLQ